MTIEPSFAEASARERARAILDAGTFRELLDPFARVASPHLAAQGLVAQSDDGVVVARGALAGVDAVAIATEGRFLGGSIGEVGGAKIAGALELAARDLRAGRAFRPVLLIDSGGIRVQEANLALLALAEIHDAILACERYAPVVALIGGRVGAYGGMAIATALCRTIAMSEGARYGLNGPEVVEEEAGIAELDSRDRPRIWRISGGRARVAQGVAQMLVEDTHAACRAAVLAAFGDVEARV
ncbi:MAG TPA: biotin-independent malonate decarboxylase subunit beta [Candidatus Limnocylindria bacterium]|nr:biotin-independent malonate decarboxylase subunit beta [Candidatus Limnocylindria bacterium]